MTVPARPNVVVTQFSGETVGVTVYESLDHVDEALYNQIGTEYLRAAFLDIISKWRNDTVGGVARTPLISNGHDIERLWKSKKAYWAKKRKRSRMVPRPHHVASPPVPTSPAPTPSGPTISPSTPTPPSSAPEIGGLAPNSPLVGENSPDFIGARPRNHPQNPTRGQRKEMSAHNNGNWQFAQILYQRKNSSMFRDYNGQRVVYKPWKAVWLLVQTSETGTIEDRIVAKFLVLLDENDESPALQEIFFNEKLASVGCRQILQWCGSGKRTKVQRIVGEQPKAIDEFYMYTEFASLGTLYDIADSYYELDDESRHVHEHFIWYFLGEMADALLALQTGRCESSGAPHPRATPWVPMLHNDIKDINIALDTGNTKYPTYPRVLLFDFDLAEEHEDISQCPRTLGTRLWTPPERILGEEQHGYFAPYTWPLSEKADIWSVGLAAFQLMKAHHGTSEFYRLMESFIQRFVEQPSMFQAQAMGDQSGVFPTLLSDSSLPSQYSVELCRIVRACLQFHPDDRPDLQTILTTARKQLEILDRTHRQEFSKGHDSILEDFRLEYGSTDYSAFDAGAHFEPQRSRRPRFCLAEYDENYERYRTHLRNWADTAMFPRSSRRRQLATMTAIAAFIGRSSLHVINELSGFEGDSAITLAWRHLYSTICLEINPDAEVYRVDSSSIRDLRLALTPDYKSKVLNWLMTYILPGMLSDPYQIIMRESLLMLQHACEWGRALLCFAGEPLAPVLQDGSPMHRAIRNYALDPNHVLHGEVDFDEDDDDDDDDEQSLGQTTSLHFSFPTRVRVVPHSQRSPEPGQPADPNHTTTIHHHQDPVENQISQEINSRTISSPVPEASDSLVDYDSDYWK